MSTQFVLEGSAIYDTWGTPYRKVSSPVNLPVTISYNTSIQSQLLPFFFYKIPDELKMKRVTATVRINVTISGNTDLHNILCYTYIRSNTLENLMGDTLGNSDPATLDTWTNTTYLKIDQKISTGAGTYTLTKSAQIYVATGEYIYVSARRFNNDITVNLNWIELTYEDDAVDYIEPRATYPVGVAIKNNIAQTFTWTFDMMTPQRPNPSDPVPPILQHTIEYNKIGSETINTLTVSDDKLYQVIPANTFEVGKYRYRVKNESYWDTIFVTDWIRFDAIGADTAPTITNVTNDSIPTVTWTDTNQAAYEVRIKDDHQNVLYYSGIIISEDLSHKANKMLKNGTYIVEVRELNNYGMFSEWGSLEFTINTSAVDPPTNVFVSVNNKHGVEISGTPAENAQKTLVVRKKIGEEDAEIIGIYEGGIFIDYTAEGNTFYEYTLRNYDVGYSDGKATPVQDKIKQFVLMDGRNLENHINLEHSDDANYMLDWTEERSKILINVLGRKYPVKEQGEWFSKVRKFNAYVKSEDWNKLLDIYYNADVVYLKADHDFFACDMDIKDGGQYIGGGSIISFTMTRIEDSKGIIQL